MSSLPVWPRQFSRVFSTLTRGTLLFFGVGAMPLRADVHLHPLFSDHAVLQRGKPVRVWGWANPGEAVSVAFAGQTVKTTTGSNGKWSAVLASLSANAIPATLRVQGQNTVEIQDLLVGEVWICSGQSNMEWPMSRSFQADADIQAGANPNLRLFTVVKNRSQVPLDNFADPTTHAWKVSAPDAVRSFTAVGYYFGRDLQAALGVPVGLIHTSWGGSPAEVWMSEGALKSNHVYARDILDPWLLQLRTYQQNVAAWESEKKNAAQNNQPFAKNRPGMGWTPAELYNGMLHPLIPYGIAGAIWYQGESNAGRAFEYRSLFADMIRNWRQDFGQGDIGFLAVQLAPFDRNKKRSLSEIGATPVESDWAELREAQGVAMKALPNVGVAVITDVGDKDDIHPTKKQPVGARLALLAERMTYGLPVQAQGPILRSAIPSGDHVNLMFDEAATGLKSLDGGDLQGFAVAGADRVWHWAKAVIKPGNLVQISCADVARPVAVRYGWADYPIVNLANSAGLPASPFRTDNWPMLTTKR